MNNDLFKFYDNNCKYIEELWEDYIMNKEWGSGEDRIKITDSMFWEFVEKLMEDNATMKRMF